MHFGAVIVKAEASRLIVTAGGSVFGLRIRGAGALSLQEGGLEPGDTVDVDADVSGGQIEAGTEDVDETGHVETLVLEGIFLSANDEGGFDLAVVHRGLVHVSVPTGMVLPDFRAGDQILVVVTVSADGKFSFVKGQGEHRTEPPPVEAYAFGPLVELSSFSVGVKRDNGEVLRCSVPAGLNLSVFGVGDTVKLYCARHDGQLAMKKLASDHATVTGDGTGEARFEGTVGGRVKPGRKILAGVFLGPASSRPRT